MIIIKEVKCFVNYKKKTSILNRFINVSHGIIWFVNCTDSSFALEQKSIVSWRTLKSFRNCRKKCLPKHFIVTLGSSNWCVYSRDLMAASFSLIRSIVNYEYQCKWIISCDSSHAARRLYDTLWFIILFISEILNFYISNVLNVLPRHT